jgi:MFS family permease
MYQVQDSVAVLRVHRRLLARGARSAPMVSRTVLLLGVTSMFTDISSEMVAAVLPLYILVGQGFSPLALGLVDGLYQGGATLARLAAGFLSDRSSRRKPVAVVGYGLSALARVGLLVVGGLSAISAMVVVDRTGKGIRTAPRDAMISLSTPEHQLGTAFGVHRALDTTGAVIGPLVGFAILALDPAAFHSVFLLSLCFALIGLGVLTLLVDEPRRRAREERVAPEISLRRAVGLLSAPRFRALAVVGTVLGLVSVGDTLIYYTLLVRMDVDRSYLPLLVAGQSVVFMLLAVPFGRLADRVGRVRVFLGGYLLLACVYASVLLPSMGATALVAALLMMGAYYAATDGVLPALGSPHIPEELRASGLALLGTATSVARLLASVAFGALWTLTGITTALPLFAVALVLVALVSTVLLRASRPARDD